MAFAGLPHERPPGASAVLQWPLAQGLRRQAELLEPGDQFVPLPAPTIGPGLDRGLDLQHDGDGPDQGGSIPAPGDILDGIGHQRHRLHCRVQRQVLLVGAEAVHPGVVPDVRAVTAGLAQAERVGVGRGADLPDIDQLVPGAVAVPMPPLVLAQTTRFFNSLRYYISRRLVTERRQKHPDAWRLPARDLETGIARILRDHLTKPTVLTDLVREVSAAEIPGLHEKFRQLANDCDPDGSADIWAPLLRRADLQQGSILLRLDRKVLAERLGIRPDRIDSAARRISASFQMQRRGVEARIILGAAVPQVDPVLAKNILAAQHWYAAIKAGASFVDLATKEKTTTSRIQQMIGLAFLAPDILDQVAARRQPVAFTSEWVKRRQLPADWDQQRQIVGGL